MFMNFTKLYAGLIDAPVVPFIPLISAGIATGLGVYFAVSAGSSKAPRFEVPKTPSPAPPPPVDKTPLGAPINPHAPSFVVGSTPQARRGARGPGARGSTSGRAGDGRCTGPRMRDQRPALPAHPLESPPTPAACRGSN
jgi:hypothetical protein